MAPPERERKEIRVCLAALFMAARIVRPGAPGGPPAGYITDSLADADALLEKIYGP